MKKHFVHLKKHVITFLLGSSFLLLSGLGMTGLHAQTSIWANAYYAGWMQGYNNTGYLPAQKIDYSAVTHISHFSILAHADGTIDASANGMSDFNANELVTRAHAAGVKVLVTIGGWATDGAFRGATSSANVDQFNARLISIMKSRHYDGIDIDWEPIASTDAAQYTTFINKLRASLDSITPRPLLTAAVSWQPALFAALKDKFDQINIMTYDMSGAWQGWVSWHNSPIYNAGATFPSNGNPLPSADAKVASYAAAGVPLSKLGIGIDFYGYVWSGGAGTTTGGVTDPRQAWTTAPSVQDNVPYYTIMQNYYQSSYYKWDAAAQASYLSIDETGSASDKFISYDEETTCQKKVQYAQTKGIGGVIVWELGGGYRPSMPAGQQDVLLQAIKKARGVVSTTDGTPPVVSVTAPANGSAVNGLVNLAASASDNVGVAGVQFKLDGSNLGAERVTAPFTVAWNTALGANGSHTISATARDAAGNSTTSSVSVTVSNVLSDSIRPVVSMTAPANGASVSGTVALAATATDNIAVAGVQFRLNGAVIGNEDVLSPYGYSWNSASVPNGTVTLSAVARDAAGNTATSSITVSVANAPPPPPPSDSASTVVVRDNFDRSDQRPVSGGKWSDLANQEGSGTMEIATNAIEAYNTGGVGHTGGVCWDSLLSNGAGISLTVSQKANSNAYHSLFMYLRMSSKDLASGDGYRFRFVDNPSATDLIAIQRVSAGVNGTDLAKVEQEINVGDTVKFVSLNDASGTLAVYINGVRVLAASDVVYNPSNWYAWIRSIIMPTQAKFDNFTIFRSTRTSETPDSEKPVVAFVSPASGAALSGNVPVSLSASDNIAVVGIQLRLDGANLGGELTSPPYAYTWNTASVANGAHVLSATARDAAGNQTSVLVNVTVANSAAPAMALVLYDDSLRTPWISNSWGATVNYQDSSVKFDGSRSISVKQKPWGAFSVHNGLWHSSPGVSPSSYQTFECAVFGGAAGMKLAVMFENDMGNAFPKVNVGTIPVNTWKVISIPMAQLNPKSLVIHRVDIMDMSGSTKRYAVDNIRFISNPAQIARWSPLAGNDWLEAPKEIALHQNFPNPFNPSTVIRYELPGDAFVTLEVYNTLGQLVSRLVEETQVTGAHEAIFDGSSVASGIYFYRLVIRYDGEAAPVVQIRKMILTK